MHPEIRRPSTRQCETASYRQRVRPRARDLPKQKVTGPWLLFRLPPICLRGTPPTAAEPTTMAERGLRDLTGVTLTRAEGGEIRTLSRERQRTSTESAALVATPVVELP